MLLDQGSRKLQLTPCFGNTVSFKKIILLGVGGTLWDLQNTVLSLECSTIHHITCLLSGCFHTMPAELSHWDTDYMAYKALHIYYLRFSGKGLFTSDLDSCEGKILLIFELSLLGTDF
jgi:hypothetical protein